MQNKEVKKELEKIEKQSQPKTTDKGYWIGFAICSGICLLICGLIILYEVTAFTDYSWEAIRFLVFVDGFTLSGGLMCLIYILVWLSGEGAFDAISYGVKVAYYTTFHKNLRETKLPKNYTEYRLLKREKEKAKISFMLYSGLIFLLIGLILLIPYNIFKI